MRSLYPIAQEGTTESNTNIQAEFRKREDMFNTITGIVEEVIGTSAG